MLRIDRTSRLSIVCLALIITGFVWLSCDRDERKPDAQQAESKLDTDFSGRLTAALAADSVSAADSLNLLQLAYQAASFSAQFYNLQNALTKSYFYACHEKCEKASCSPGNILAAAMCYYLEGNADSAVLLCDLIESSDEKRANEATEIAAVIRQAAVPDRNLYSYYKETKLKTPVAIAFLAVADIDNGGSPKAWAADLQQYNKRAEFQPLAYAYSYALAQTGEIINAVNELTYYPPLTKNYPAPSFTEKVMIADSLFTQEIYLPQDLYIRMRIDDLLLRSLLDKALESTANPAARAIAALAEVKRLRGPQQEPLIARQADQSAQAATDIPATEEIVKALALVPSANLTVAERLKTIDNPIARAAFIKKSADQARLGENQEPLLDQEVNLLREQPFWEGRILISEALMKALGGPAAFKKMSNFGVLDLSVRNNPPEWLAIYARAGLEEGSQVALITQIIFNLTQHYPYAIGMYETMQMYNHLCKYY